jgi:putative ABC transport system permease protein
MTVVGEALLYDGAALEPGEAAVVDARWFGPQNERVADAIVVRLSSRTPNWRPLSDAGLTAVPPPAPPGVRNLQQIDGMPTVIVVLVALLAFAALAHALTTMSHIQNRQLAVLRALGLRPYQRLEVLACAALSVVLVGLAIGVPLGLALERWLWSTLAEHIGFASPWFGGWRALAIVVIAALASGLAISAVQARHRPSAASLRAE